MEHKSFDQFKKEAGATLKAESEIIRDKLELGEGGLEWLIEQVNPDYGHKIEALVRFIEFVRKVSQKDIHSVFKDAVHLQPDDFYERHELNWWITIEEALTYFAIVKKHNEDGHYHLMKYIFGR